MYQYYMYLRDAGFRGGWEGNRGIYFDVNTPEINPLATSRLLPPWAWCCPLPRPPRPPDPPRPAWSSPLPSTSLPFPFIRAYLYKLHPV